MPLYNLPTNLYITGQTTGDLLYFNGSGWVKFSPESEGTFLQVQSGVPAWKSRVKNNVTGSTSAPTTTSNSYVVIPEMTSTIVTSGGNVLLFFNGSFNVQSDDDFTIGIHQDSVLISDTERRVSFFGGSLLGLTPANMVSAPISIFGIVSPSTGSHTYDVRWKQSAGTARAITTMRQFTTIEIL